MMHAPWGFFTKYKLKMIETSIDGMFNGWNAITACNNGRIKINRIE